MDSVTQEQKWEEWIIYILEAIRVTSDWTLDLVNQIKTLQEETEAKIRGMKSKLPAADLSGLLLTHPYLRIEHVVQKCSISRQTASTWLKQLESEGLLNKINTGNSKVFINDRFLELLFTNPLPQEE